MYLQKLNWMLVFVLKKIIFLILVIHRNINDKLSTTDPAAKYIQNNLSQLHTM